MRKIYLYMLLSVFLLVLLATFFIDFGSIFSRDSKSKSLDRDFKSYAPEKNDGGGVLEGDFKKEKRSASLNYSNSSYLGASGGDSFGAGGSGGGSSGESGETNYFNESLCNVQISYSIGGFKKIEKENGTNCSFYVKNLEFNYSGTFKVLISILNDESVVDSKEVSGFVSPREEVVFSHFFEGFKGESFSCNFNTLSIPKKNIC